MDDQWIVEYYDSNPNMTLKDLSFLTDLPIDYLKNLLMREGVL